MIKRTSIAIDDASGWRKPVVFLMIMVAANGFTFATWGALLNNFAIERVNFTGAEIGTLQSLREIPGLLAFTAVGFLYLFREQTFAIVSLLLLGLGTALTGFFPTNIGFYTTTVLMSFGFHYYETMNQSLTLQWLPRKTAPGTMGKILAAGSIATITAFATIFVTWWLLELDFKTIYLISGGVTIIIAIFLWFAFPHFEEKTPQKKTIVLKSRYWLYYALTFMAGARRQIFIVFAGFLMVEKFGFTVPQITMMFLANALFNIYFAPKIGGLIVKWGERNALTLEYVGLILVFVSYAFVENATVAGGLYIIDHAFFAMAIAMKTYFQKIADPADIAPTAGIAFSINHIAAVFIPVIFGFIWLQSHSAVFLIGAAMAFISLCLSLLIPRDPHQGNETVLGGPSDTSAAPATAS
jgi:MFS family permease